MSETLLRAEALLGAEAMARLRAARILVVGLGAVGGACVEALARSGVGELWLVDGDVFVDAIDDVPAKLALLSECLHRGIPAWSAMGAARKYDPSALCVTDLSKTQVCPLARRIRQGLRALGFTKGVRCVWSREPAAPQLPGAPLGSFMPVTASAGLLLAADVIKSLSSAE